MKEAVMVRALLLAVCGACVLVGCAGGGASEKRMEEAGVVVSQELTTGEKFAVYVPRGEAPKGGWPCIVFLNGRGECGTDGKKQLSVGLMPAVELRPSEWPFVIVFPQKPTEKSKWIDHKEMVYACMEQAQGKWPVDKSRVYLTGLSQGGNGTWEIAADARGRTFAALAPVCGYGDPEPIAGMAADMPVWAFHGEKDDVVPPDKTRAIVRAIEVFGRVYDLDLHAVYPEKDDGTDSRLRMTIYPDLNHGCWDRAYRDSGMPAWFLRFTTEASFRGNRGPGE
jgi:predicted peptidase